MASPWVEDALRADAGTTSASSAGDEDVAGYIRSAASKRGIDPEVAIKVAQSEGGLVPNRTGSFDTGKSFWPFQLHYGGPGYERFGNVAGMGNSFTAQTGYQPGDPNAWRAATDYALDAAAKNGWGAWYGARNVGVTGYQGINRRGESSTSTSFTPPATSTAGMAGMPPWVTDLFSGSGAPAGASGVEPLPNPTPSSYASPAGVQTLPNAPKDAPPWVLDALRNSPPAYGEGVGTGPSYDGPPQTDEVWPVAGHKWGQVNNPFGGPQARSAGASVALPSSNVGADLTASYGDDVVAPVSGTVIEAFDAPNENDRNLNRGWGGSVVLLGDNGYTYRLSHLQPGLRVHPGMRVARGQQLGDVGVSGNTTGPHLDAEKYARPGEFTDIVAGRGGTVAAPAGSSGGDRSVTPGGYTGPLAGLSAWARDALGR